MCEKKPKILTQEEMKNGESGYIYVPYVIKTTTEPDKEYDDFIRNYKEEHKYCPKCGSFAHSSTLMAFMLDMDKKEEFKDENHCICVNCGYSHIFHTRVNIQLQREKKLKRILSGTEFSKEILGENK